MISHVSNAHEDSVNCICFLDNRLFATCSDDTTVALWDARYLKKKLKSMRGHSNWVKNIEYSAKDNYLGQAHDMFSRIFRIMNLRIFSTK